MDKLQGVKGFNYKRLAQFVTEPDYKSVEFEIDSLVEELYPYFPERLDGVLENLTSTPADRLSEQDFAPLLQYIDQLLSRSDMGNKDIFEEFQRKIFFLMKSTLGL